MIGRLLKKPSSNLQDPEKTKKGTEGQNRLCIQINEPPIHRKVDPPEILLKSSSDLQQIRRA